MKTNDMQNSPHLVVSPTTNVDGYHVIRWCETMNWGVKTYLITTAKPTEMNRARQDFDLFALVPAEKRAEAAETVRMSLTPAADLLTKFILRNEKRVYTQQSLF